MNRSLPVRPDIQQMSGYTPGEQPDPNRPLIKLNTNENPYPPPEAVLAAIRQATDQTLRRYPQPASDSVRQSAARAYGLSPEQVVVGNGSDDLLTMILRTFINPKEIVASPSPTYSLYETLTTIQGGVFQSVPWCENGSLPTKELLRTGAKVIFVVRPNAPTGHLTPLTEVATLCQESAGVVVLDEAYVDFATDNGIPLLKEHDNLILTRTFSKSLSLAGLRVGLGFMSPQLAKEIHKVRDSYNLNRLSQAGAVAALDNLALYQPNIQAICTERQRLTEALRERGFQVPESHANFILATVPNNGLTGQQWLSALREKGYLVRYFGNDPVLADKIRVTIGTQQESDGFLAAVDGLLS